MLHYGGWPKKSITPGQPLAQPRISPTSLNYTAVQSLASKAEASKPTPPPAKPAEAAPKEAPKPKNEPPPQTPSPKKLEDKKAKAALNLAGPFPAPLYSNGTTVAGLQAEASKRSVGVFWDHEVSVIMISVYFRSILTT
ncbi:hypothetical protein FRB99_007734 [Tulasnella sp. 403]|nr:hypothetical protein FRB99_007734 [Tulasnella sp. 403]